MISILKKVIRDHPEWLHSSGAELSFLKLSTPSSGAKLHKGKVLIFVFEEGRELPTLCVKTSRTQADGEEIRRNYKNLKTLSGSMFANALYLHDDGKHIFSIETVCPGHKFKVGADNVDLVVDAYCSWQTALLHDVKKSFNPEDLKTTTFNAIDLVEVPDDTKDGLKHYYETLAQEIEVHLPELIQHGDVTPDNVLVHKGHIFFIDYDYVGFSNVPGFDLFHFLMKSKSFDERYFKLYFEKIGAHISSYKALFFLFYIQESVRKGTGNKKTTDTLIKDFESLTQRS